MPKLEQALESLATRGDARGAGALIERLESELTSPSVSPRLVPGPRTTRGPVVWRRGLAVALATSAVVLFVGALGAVVAQWVGAPSAEVTDSSVTTVAPVVPPVPEVLFDGMVVREGDVIGVFESAEFVPLVHDECCVGTALSDLAGGVVFQRDDTAILWAAAENEAGGSPTVLVEGVAGERVSLEGVAAVDGEPTVLFVRSDSTVDGDRQTLATAGLVSGSRADIGVVGEGDVRADRVSYANGAYLVSVGSGDGTWFEFRDDSGTVAAVANNPRSVPGETAVSQGVLNGGGDVMVYIERQAADSGGGLADLVTFDLERGRELTRHHIVNFGDRIVAFDGDRVIIDRQMANPALPSVMVAWHLGEGATYTSEGGFTVGVLGN